MQEKSVPQDDAKTAFWVQKAAKQGNIAAQSILGNLYRDGKGIKQDYMAAYGYPKAAEQDISQAKEKLKQKM